MIAGCDFDTFKVTVGLVPIRDEPERRLYVETLAYRGTRHRSAVRGSAEGDQFQALARVLPAAIKASRLLPLAEGVWLERGFGASRKADFSMGRVEGAIAVLLSDLPSGRAGRVNEIPLSDWKKELGFSGVAKKEVYQPLLRDILSAYLICRVDGDDAPDVLPTVLTHDELDALGIALAAQRENARALR